MNEVTCPIPNAPRDVIQVECARDRECGAFGTRRPPISTSRENAHAERDADATKRYIRYINGVPAERDADVVDRKELRDAGGTRLQQGGVGDVTVA